MKLDRQDGMLFRCEIITVKLIPYGNCLSTAASSEALRLNSDRGYNSVECEYPGCSLP